MASDPIFSEFFWSRRSAENAGQRCTARYGYNYSVDFARRADGSHDWRLRVSA